MLALLSFALLSLVTLIQAQDKGTIIAPTSGTKIRPGQSFPFNYKIHQDYCTSSHNITVALLTSPPNSATNTGHFFGRFGTGSYPAQGLENPNPPPPDHLVMPDFSQRPGGFGTGKAASNLPVWITVIEEWNTCEPTIGNNLWVASVQAVYNATY
ncbi:hypothetical protein CPB86DRAFT_822114 [Serendipita vermifera]|nr:hypothetical protein CPB86DRAFT_822114 [Serendipita vermifera]